MKALHAHEYANVVKNCTLIEIDELINRRLRGEKESLFCEVEKKKGDLGVRVDFC